MRTEFAKQLHEYGIRLHKETMPPGDIEKIRVVALHGMRSADIHVGRALDFERLVQSVEQHDVLTLLRKRHAAEFGDGLTAPRRLGNRSSHYTGYQTSGEITPVHACFLLSQRELQENSQQAF